MSAPVVTNLATPLSEAEVLRIREDFPILQTQVNGHPRENWTLMNR